MGQDVSKAAADVGDKMKDALLRAGTRLAERLVKKDSDGGGKKTRRGERCCGFRRDNCTCAQNPAAAAKKADGRKEKEGGKREASDGKKPQTPEETLDFLRRFGGPW
ncbi:hypothetical protein C8A01DRAFT_35149 [Parachaetomium inaequale]|uniref:Uncharacterized protein n=1 Tax=Parachaetomium inaequale TaxID=2588326 RepID=A0AAN6PH47_9PEZI|nr:hypothetical protein C8A01DRAFT_35149 [Parachaetomium inaequale]